ncbi:MAG: NADH-quinone oxidoreductase subunit N [Gammaproteobacteria bacterium]|nr:NADH-quinone oxidoreductase subunit N [Gammaproteobacteria bacterium]
MIANNSLLLAVGITSALSLGFFQQWRHVILGLFSVVGMLALIFGSNLITIFIAMELLSLPLYALAASSAAHKNSYEAAIKFFVLGLLATSIILFGISLLFGVTHSLEIHTIAQHLIRNNITTTTALVFILVGATFKLGVIPFHTWAPDVFTTADPKVTLFIGGAPKIAAVVLALRLLVTTHLIVHLQWQLIAIGLASMIIGNIVAMIQTDIKRILGFSAIGQAGFAILGFATLTPQGYQATLFYITMYALMFITAFGVIALCDDIKGLHQRQPFLAAVMLITILAMAGLPPTIGLITKIAVLKSLIDVHLVWVAVVAAVISVAALYYYLKIIKSMYFDRNDAQPTLNIHYRHYVLLAIQTILIILLMLFIPGLLLGT